MYRIDKHTTHLEAGQGGVGAIVKLALLLAHEQQVLGRSNVRGVALQGALEVNLACVR